MTLVLRYSARSDRGLVRQNNQDAVYAGPRLLALADGMGGHAAGEVASSLVITALAQLDEDQPGDDLLGSRHDATVQGNAAITRHVADQPDLEGMGTTLTAILFAGWLAAAAPARTVRGVSDREILMGMSAAFSGQSQELGNRMKLGIETGFAEVNEAGGVAGRKLRLVALDDGYDPMRCAETMKDMIERRPVFAFVGNVGTPTAEVAVPIVLQHKRVLEQISRVRR